MGSDRMSEYLGSYRIPKHSNIRQLPIGILSQGIQQLPMNSCRIQ